MEKEELMVLVREYIDVFAWNYEDMPGLDPQVAMHRLNIRPDAKPVAVATPVSSEHYGGY